MPRSRGIGLSLATAFSLLVVVCAPVCARALEAPGALIPAGAAYGPAPGLAPIRQSNNRDAADTVNAEHLHPGGSLGLELTGAGYTVGIWDGGWVRTTHQEFAIDSATRVTIKDGGVEWGNHATHVAGTIGAAGVVGLSLGMAPEVNIWSYDWVGDTVEMADAAGSIVASNHSYSFTRGWTFVYAEEEDEAPNGEGYYGQWYANRYDGPEDLAMGKYTVDSQALDAVLHDNPSLLSVWSAGNERGEDYGYLNTHYLTYLEGGEYNGWYWVPTEHEEFPAPDGDGDVDGGYDCLSELQTSKNTMVVGAVHDVIDDPYARINVSVTSYSSWGPVDDGRIKPDVVANGQALFSAHALADGAYSIMSGTSMAVPSVVGTSVLLVEHFENSFGSLPRAATTKGIIAHTAFDAGNAGPDYAYGWGLLDAKAAAEFITSAAASDEIDRIIEGQYAGVEQTFEVYLGRSGIMRCTLSWTDPEAELPVGYELDDPTVLLVNDLNIWVTGGEGDYLSWTLDPADPSAPAARMGNHVDNLEQVFFRGPAGWYTVHVGHSGPDFTQDYTLLITSTPEPATLGILLAGGIGVMLRRRRSYIA